MSVTTKKVQYKQLHCLYSRLTGDQLGPLKANDPDLERFMQLADQRQYGVATVNFRIENGKWQITSQKPEKLNLRCQFLSAEQRQVLATEQ